MTQKDYVPTRVCLWAFSKLVYFQHHKWGKKEVITSVVLETRVLISRRLEDKNESLGLGS